MTIDAHLHLWDLDTGDYGWNTPALGAVHGSFGAAQARAALDSAGVAAAVLVQAGDTRGDTERMFAVAEQEPWVAGVVAWLPLADPSEAGRLLDEWSDRPVVGIRQLLHDHPDPALLDAADVRRTIGLLGERGLPLDVPDAWPRLWPALARLAAESSTTLVLDHLGKPAPGSAGPEWRAALAALAAHPHVVAKLSGFAAFLPPGEPVTADAIAPFVDAALAAFGPDRLMFGGDWPISLSGGDYAAVTAAVRGALAGLSAAERDAVFDGTARRVYGLRPAAA